MHPSRRAEELLDKHHTAADREAAMILAVLAVSQAIQDLGAEVNDAAKTIAFAVESSR